VIDKALIDPNALQFYRILKEAGFSAYFVGGSVRDLLLGKVPKDFDIATNATPQQIKRVIPQGRIIGRRFRHVMLEKQGGRYEIVTFRGPVVEAELEQQAELDDEPLEDNAVTEGAAGAPAEARSAGGRDGREPRRNYPDLNQFGNAEQDAKRRDFTINALFYDPDADELVDYVEGKFDIDRKLVRTIGQASARMTEDPIRILRAIRHKMKLGLEYDVALEAAMRDKAPLLQETSKDRIREEFLKVCNDHSLGDFLAESRRMGLVPHTMPWFETISDAEWNEGMKLWEQLKKFPISERASPDLGLSLMMAPLVSQLVLEPYKATLKEEEKTYLPDMKYFLSCENLRNFYLRNLRISRAQTDHIVRTLFYYSRMSGLWLEQGPPRRIVGRLFQHPPALLAAKMVKILLDLQGKETPPWILELANYDAGPRQREDRDDRGGRDRGGRDRGRGRGRDRDDNRREREQDQAGADISRAEGAPEGEDTYVASEEGSGPVPRVEGDRDHDRPRRRESHEGRAPRDRDDSDARGPREPKVNRLPPPDAPMIWNGPLHAPVLRPKFNEEQLIRWARKNQTVRAYRPSGIPNQPVDHALLKSDLVYNYKPELENAPQRPSEEGGERGSGDRGGERGGSDRGGERGRGRERGRRGRGRERGAGGRDRGGEQRADREGGGAGPVPVAEREPGAEGTEPVQQSLDSPNEDAQPANVSHERPSRSRSPRPRPPSDDDSIGNRRRPGEAPAALADLETNTYNENDADESDDDIGNRLDAPPTSGHVGMNGEGVLAPQRGTGRLAGGPRGAGAPSSGGAAGEGGAAGTARRRGRRRGRRGGSGGTGGSGGSGAPGRGAPRSPN
jgi:tRNA nucleotidyltransferase/poly(A) polymerase